MGSRCTAATDEPTLTPDAVRSQDPDNDLRGPEPLEIDVDQSVVQARDGEAERARVRVIRAGAPSFARI